MAQNKTLEEVLKEYFAPTEPKEAKGEPQFIIVVNGKVITSRIKSRADLDKQLRSIALGDVTRGTSTNVLVYKLEGKAEVSFESTVSVGTETPEVTESTEEA